MITEFQKQIGRLEHEVNIALGEAHTLREEIELRDAIIRDNTKDINRLAHANAAMQSALEEIASDIDPKQTWNFLAVKRRMIARVALDKLRDGL